MEKIFIHFQESSPIGAHEFLDAWRAESATNDIGVAKILNMSPGGALQATTFDPFADSLHSLITVGIDIVAAGVVGNAAYDLIKSTFRRIAKGDKMDEVKISVSTHEARIDIRVTKK